MARNLVLCFDGTNNAFRLEKTNVARLVHILDRQAHQLVYYDPSISTLPEPGLLTRLTQRLAVWVDLAFATRLLLRVQAAYGYLIRSWEPGDQVFLFGFGRGAYVARVLAAMLHVPGLLPRGADHLLPHALRVFGASRNDLDNAEQCARFRQACARNVSEGTALRAVPVHFLGVWDTVSLVGWVWNPDPYWCTTANPSIRIARHAVSLDERRWFFRHALLPRVAGQDLKEYWFPGVHGDVGGGYPDSCLWQASFAWMVEEARRAGLLLETARYAELTAHAAHTAPAWLAEQHESLRGAWWLAEVVPKVAWDDRGGRRRLCFGLGRHRDVPVGAMISGTVSERLRANPGYDPPNLSVAFKQRARQPPVSSVWGRDNAF